MNRDKLYGLFGMETAWRRFETRDAAAGARGEFERRMRAMEPGAERLNLAPAMVHLAAEIAAFEPALDHEDRLALILLVTMSLAALQAGSTRLAIGGEAGGRVMAPMLQALCGDAFGTDGAAQAAARIKRILAENRANHVIARDRQAYAPLIHVGPFLCHHRILLAESSLANSLRERLWAKPVRSPDAREVKDAIADIVNRPVTVSERSIKLSGEQREAVMRAVVSRFTLITGGPGTGKTSIVVAILRMLARLGVGPDRIVVAAPTGRAAFRISENVTESLKHISDSSESDKTLRQCSKGAVTIHRLLGYRPGNGSFRYHANNPLNASVVIVDECSMLDLVLAERLLRAMPDDAQLVMLGDADQLPSVTAGAVFRDLVEVAENGPRATQACVRLTHSYRMDREDEGGGTIARVAAAINQNDSAKLTAGDSESSPIARRANPEDLVFEGVEMLTDVPPARIGLFLSRWHERFVRADEIDELARRVYPRTENRFDESSSHDLMRLLDFRAASRILCLTRVLPTGTERVNRLMHRLSLEAAPNSDEAGGFIAGEPVMVVRNDYERELFNGDHGVVVKVGSPGRHEVMMAAFNRCGRMVAFPIDALRESLELSYATTVHKAQGSEFESVALILPEAQLPILSREIHYTAVTRSRNSVVIVGDAAMLGESAARPIERHSGLRDLLLSGSG